MLFNELLLRFSITFIPYSFAYQINLLITF
ncbi:hypothetical protein VCSRO88_0631 [Vibrio cholerae]|nr:hypothetical protein VCSRO88_0631 [Vibrio cholerae]